MAEGWSATAANAALTSAGSTYTWIQRHIGAPGAAGTSNVAADATRKQVTWGAASGGAMSNATAASWTTVTADEDYTYWTAWTASNGGTFGWSGTLTGNAVVTGDGYDIAIGDLDVALPLAS